MKSPKLKSIFAKIAYSYLPNRLKKMMFLCSLYGIINGKEKLDDFEKTILNNKFNLCENIQSMDFPTLVARKIWDGCRTKKREADSLDRYARVVVAFMPCWLVYDNIFNIVRDVKKLMKYQYSRTAS